MEDVRVAAFIQQVRREAPSLIWWTLFGCAVLYQLTPLFTVWRPVPAAWLDDDARDRHAHALAKSPVYLVRQIAFLLKMFAGLCWGGDPQVRRQLAVEPLSGSAGGWRSS